MMPAVCSYESWISTTGLLRTAVACLHDSRDSGKVKHDILTLARQCLFAIPRGYEDNNGAAWPAKDPSMKIMAGKTQKAPETWPPSLPCLALRTG